MKTITSSDDTISKDALSAYVEELEGQLEALEYDVEMAQEALDEAKTYEGDLESELEAALDSPNQDVEEAQEVLESALKELSDWREEFSAPLKDMGALLDELNNYDTDYLINESYWHEYARGQVEEALEGKDLAWPFNCIDYDEAIEELESNYSTYEFEGVTFYGL